MIARAFETRIELINHRANSALEFLDRLDNGLSIVERYLRNEVEIHLHFVAGASLCRSYRTAGGHECAVSDLEPGLVLIRIGEAGEPPKPSPSIIRLQQFNGVPVCRIYPAQIHRFLLPEVRSLPENRELRSFLGSARVEVSQFVNQVVQWDTGALDNFTDQCSNAVRERHILSGQGDRQSGEPVAIGDLRHVLRDIVVELKLHGIRVFLPEPLCNGFEFVDVGFSPIQSFEGGFKGCHDVHSDHERRAQAGTETEDAEGLRDTDSEEVRLGSASQEGRHPVIPSQPEEVASQPSAQHRRGANSAKRTRSGNPEDA